MRRQVAGKYLAVIYQCLIGGKDEDVTGAADFVQAVLLAQSGFGRDQVGNRIGIGAQYFRRPQHDLGTFETRQLRFVLTRDTESIADIADSRLRDRPDQLAVVGIEHLDQAIITDQFAGNPHLLAQRFASFDFVQFA